MQLRLKIPTSSLLFIHVIWMKYGSVLNLKVVYRKDILASVKPMDIRDYAVLVNKCRLVEEYSKKLMVAKSTKDDFRRKLAPQG